MDKTVRYQRVEGMVQRNIAGETLLVPVVGGIADVMNLYVLNPTALALWQHLEEPRTMEELIAHLQEASDGAPAQVREDCLRFLQQMEQLGLVRKV